MRIFEPFAGSSSLRSVSLFQLLNPMGGISRCVLALIRVTTNQFINFRGVSDCKKVEHRLRVLDKNLVFIPVYAQRNRA